MVFGGLQRGWGWFSFWVILMVVVKFWSGSSFCATLSSVYTNRTDLLERKQCLWNCIVSQTKPYVSLLGLFPKRRQRWYCRPKARLVARGFEEDNLNEIPKKTLQHVSRTCCKPFLHSSSPKNGNLNLLKITFLKGNNLSRDLS